jgi:hypothetical protein
MDNGILALHGLIAGLKSADKQALIDIVNNAESNQSSIKTNVANALNSASTSNSLDLSSTSTWSDILNAIPNMKTGKKWATGVSGALPANTSEQPLTITGLDFKPSIIIAAALDVNETIMTPYYKSFFLDSSYSWPGNLGNIMAFYSSNTTVFTNATIYTQVYGQAKISVVTYGSSTRYRWLAIE